VSNFSKSAVRTIVPLAVGYVVALAAKAGWHIKSTDVTLYLGPVISAVYYLIVRFVEEKVPAAGVLLGVPSKPQYAVKAAVETAVAEAAPVVEEAVKAEINKIATPTKAPAAKKAAPVKKAAATKSTTAAKKATK